MGVARGFKSQEILCEGLFVYYLYPEYITADKSHRSGPYVHYQNMFFVITLHMTIDIVRASKCLNASLTILMI